MTLEFKTFASSGKEAAMDNNLLSSGIADLCDLRFHRSFVLPENPAHGRPDPIRVSYADLDHRTSRGKDDPTDSGPTLLFIPGVGATRYEALFAMDANARRSQIRVLIVDNFGLGGTARVPLLNRMESWIDLVAELLIKLGIKHVALASNSAGVLYLFNALLRLRHFLHPIHPIVFIFVPWVSPKHSQKPWQCVVQYVPKIVLRKLYWGIKYLQPAKALRTARRDCQHIGAEVLSNMELQEMGERNPRTGWSELQTLGLTDLTNTSPNKARTSYTQKQQFGCHSKAVASYLRAYALKCKKLEHHSGMGDDILLCLRRNPGASWGCFRDLDEGVQLLRKQEQIEIANSDCENRLRVQVVYAEMDGLIGHKGAAWFEGLWQGHEDWVDYNSITVLDARHNQAVNPLLAWMMQEISNLWSGGGDNPGQ